ncbi:MAG: hypothetical protein LBG05_10115 [Treponema sp.]|jgi:hypothetical protein|nr:hypothetical protein [Treponema sp.]
MEKFFPFLLLFILSLGLSAQEGDAMQVAVELGRAGISFEERELFSQYGSFGTSIHIFLPSETEAIGTVAVAAPLLNRPFTQEIGIAFIEKIKKREKITLHKRPINVRVAFLADEDSTLPVDMRKNTRAGLKDLCAVLPPESVLLYLDFDGPPQKLLFTHGAKGRGTPLIAVKPLPELCKQHNIPYIFAVSNNAFFRLGLVEGQETVELAGKQEINAVFVSRKEKADVTDGKSDLLTAENIADLLVDYVETIEWADSERDDTHFAMMTNAAGQECFISETTLVVMALTGVAVLLIVFLMFSIIKRRLFIVQFRIFFIYFWVLLLFAALFFAVLEGVGAFILFIARVANIFNVLTVAFKIVVSLLTYSLIAELFDGLKIPGKQHFFSNSTVLLGVVNLLVVLFIDIDLVPIFAVCLVCIFIGAVSKIAAVCYLFAILLSLQSVSLFAAFWGNGSGELTQMLMSADISVNLAITSCTLPIWFILKRGTFLLTIRVKRQKFTLFNLFSKPKISFLIRTAFLLVFLFITVQFLFYYLKIIPIQVEPVRRVSENGLILDVKKSDFLERRIYGISIQAEGKPCRFDITLESESADFFKNFLYSCSVPFRLDGDKIELILGENPPNPFFFEIAFSVSESANFSADFIGTLRTDAIYAVYDSRVDKAGKPETEDYALTLRGVRELRE